MVATTMVETTLVAARIDRSDRLGQVYAENRSSQSHKILDWVGLSDSGHGRDPNAEPRKIPYMDATPMQS